MEKKETELQEILKACIITINYYSWGLEPQKGLGGPRLSGFPLNLIILMKTPG